MSVRTTTETQSLDPAHAEIDIRSKQPSGNEVPADVSRPAAPATLFNNNTNFDNKALDQPENAETILARMPVRAPSETANPVAPPERTTVPRAPSPAAPTRAPRPGPQGPETPAPRSPVSPHVPVPGGGVLSGSQVTGAAILSLREQAQHLAENGSIAFETISGGDPSNFADKRAVGVTVPLEHLMKHVIRGFDPTGSRFAELPGNTQILPGVTVDDYWELQNIRNEISEAQTPADASLLQRHYQRVAAPIEQKFLDAINEFQESLAETGDPVKRGPQSGPSRYTRINPNTEEPRDNGFFNNPDISSPQQDGAVRAQQDTNGAEAIEASNEAASRSDEARPSSDPTTDTTTPQLASPPQRPAQPSSKPKPTDTAKERPVVITSDGVDPKTFYDAPRVGDRDALRLVHGSPHSGPSLVKARHYNPDAQNPETGQSYPQFLISQRLLYRIVKSRGVAALEPTRVTVRYRSDRGVKLEDGEQRIIRFDRPVAHNPATGETTDSIEILSSQTKKVLEINPYFNGD